MASNALDNSYSTRYISRFLLLHLREIVTPILENTYSQKDQFVNCMSLGSPGSGSSIREGRHPTGITILDEEVLRGVPEGSTIAILGDPDAESELILHTLAATGRNTEYITTMRPEYGLVEDIAGAAGQDATKEDVRENVTIRDVESETESFGDILRKSIQLVDDGNLIVDTFSAQYNNPKEMESIARRVYSKTKQNGGLTYLYFVAEDTSELSRSEKEILQMVDGVFNVRTNVVGGSNIENNLFINKLRGVNIPDNAQSLVFSESISIDATDDIG